jgi:glycosyltransferase involved in cell wall biosynthesis
MKRVLFVLPNLDLGGTEIIVMNYFRNIGKNVVFDFVVHGESGYFEDEARALGAEIFRVPTRRQGFFKNIYAMKKIYANYDFIIVCTEHAFAFIELAVAWASGVKTRAVWSHFADYQGNSRIKRRAHFFARPFLRLFANLFFACTQDAARWLFGRLSKNTRKNFFIINNAIDLQKFCFCPDAREKIRKQHLLGDKPTIGIVGRLTAVKNHAFALEIISQIPSVLLIIGDGELRAELEDMSNERVIFTGAVENIHEYYSALDFLIVPSFHEGFSLVAIEAQAAGLPVLLSDKIPHEAKITALARTKNLKDGAQAWAQEIISVKNHKRTAVDLTDSGFDIKTESKKFQEILSGDKN